MPAARALRGTRPAAGAQRLPAHRPASARGPAPAAARRPAGCRSRSAMRRMRPCRGRRAGVGPSRHRPPGAIWSGSSARTRGDRRSRPTADRTAPIAIGARRWRQGNQAGRACGATAAVRAGAPRRAAVRGRQAGASAASQRCWIPRKISFSLRQKRRSVPSVDRHRILHLPVRGGAVEVAGQMGHDLAHVVLGAVDET